MTNDAEAKTRAKDEIKKGPANPDEVGGAPDAGGTPRADHFYEVPADREERERPFHWSEGEGGLTRVHGTALTERGRDLARRALGERYQEDQGGVPASDHATEVLDNLENVDWLNEAGDTFQLYEGAHPDAKLNQRGYALGG